MRKGYEVSDRELSFMILLNAGLVESGAEFGFKEVVEGRCNGERLEGRCENQNELNWKENSIIM